MHTTMKRKRDKIIQPEIKTDFLPISKWTRPGHKMKNVKGIVVHWVASPRSTAANVRKYFSTLNDRYAAAHYVIGQKGEIIHMIPDLEIAYHVGAVTYVPGIQKKLSNYPNNCTIGVECCHVDWAGKMETATVESLKNLCRFLLDKYDLTSDDLYLHNDVTGKDCHKWYVDNQSEWESFKQACDA